MRGRELLRRLFQDRLDLTAAREARRHDVTGRDGVRRPRAEKGRTRPLVTKFGQVTVSRIDCAPAPYTSTTVTLTKGRSGYPKDGPSPTGRAVSRAHPLTHRQSAATSPTRPKRERDAARLAAWAVAAAQESHACVAALDCI